MGNGLRGVFRFVGNPIPIDLCSVTQKGGKRLFSFLTQAFGLMADLGTLPLLLESFHYLFFLPSLELIY